VKQVLSTHPSQACSKYYYLAVYQNILPKIYFQISEWHTHLRLMKINSHLCYKCAVYTTHQLKGCGIGFSEPLESTSRMQSVGVTRLGFIIQIIQFICKLFKNWEGICFLMLINLKDNCSTGCGWKYFKTNSINLLNIGTTIKSTCNLTNLTCLAQHRGMHLLSLPNLLKTVK